MPSQAKLIKQGINYSDKLFQEIINRLTQGVKYSDTLESFLARTKDYTIANPLVTTGYDAELLDIILQETNNHKFSRPAQKELTRITIEEKVGELIRNVGDDIRNDVRDIVKHGYNNGLSQDEIVANITKRITTINNTRARVIARTEIARTATISDYVISAERGATHFYVECRNTACNYCKEAWHKDWTPETDDTYVPKEYTAGKKGWVGDIEYDMKGNVDMLPPIHPNCRCVAYFNKKNYKEDTNYQIENNQRRLQHNVFGDDFVGKSSLINWAGDESEIINGKIYNDDYYKNMIAKGRYTDAFIDHMIDDIDNCIEEAPPLQEDTILWMGREFDETLRVGEESSYDGFCSSSFQERIADNHSGYGEKYKVKIKAPKGTKGVCIQYAEEEEHEFLLGRNQRFIVEDIDTVNKTATIRLIIN